MRELRRIIPIAAVTSLVIVGLAYIAARQVTGGRTRYFSETETVIREPFLSYFDQHGGLDTFGFPLTNAYTNDDGALVQSFQRMHLEQAVRGVQPAPIGLALSLGTGEEQVRIDPAFANTYVELGGEGFLGLPVAPSRIEAGSLVQDFENARLVVDALGEVRLANLGSAYVSAFPPPHDFGSAMIAASGTAVPDALRASVSVENPTLGRSAEQTIYLYVEDASGAPVEGATSLAVLRYDGVEAEVDLPLTNAEGVAQVTFVGPPATPGSKVLVEMHILHGDTFFTVETTYFQWW